MVALLISSIVIGVVYYSYLMVKRQMDRRLRQSGKAGEYILFDNTFARDMERASEVRDSAGADHIIMNSRDRSIRYYIDTDRVVRAEAGIADTFFISAGVDSVHYISDSLRLITHVSLRLPIDRQPVNGDYTKNYTAAELLEADKERHE